MYNNYIFVCEFSANEQLESANSQLKQVMDQVAELESKLAKLTTELNAANAEKQEALDTVERGQKKLDLAQRLTNALASENVRWAENIVTMEGDMVRFIFYSSFHVKFVDEIVNSLHLKLFLISPFRNC